MAKKNYYYVLVFATLNNLRSACRHLANDIEEGLR